MSWKDTLVPLNSTIRDVILTLNTNQMQIVLVVDESQKLRGTVTDGDIRRGLLKGYALDDQVGQVMNSSPTVGFLKQSRESLLSLMRQKQLMHIPIVDEYGAVKGIEIFSEMIRPTERKNPIILMVGGLGTRLRPLTDDCPKPMLKVGGKPLLETIIESFMAYGFRHFYLSVNYKAEMIRDYFGDGSRFGIEIQYIHENKRLGTAGALSLLELDQHEEPLIVMNGDLLTKVNFLQLLDFHSEHKSLGTMCVRDYEYQVPYGVINIDKHRLVRIDEKPIYRYFVNAGIYVLEPHAVQLIPKDCFYDMPTLFEKLVEFNYETCVFPIREYWLDIGRMDDFDRANSEYMEVFR